MDRRLAWSIVAGGYCFTGAVILYPPIRGWHQRDAWNIQSETSWRSQSRDAQSLRA